MQHDPYNHLLSRGVRQRLPAEVIRDNALATGGLLVGQVGGPSVYPYQPAGTWAAGSGGARDAYPEAASVPPNDHHRRSMYTYVKRAVQHPAMQVFDMDRRVTTTARRRMSNTPLQALVLLNDPQYLESYEGMAARAMKAMGKNRGKSESVNQIYKLALRREPSESELTILLVQYDKLRNRFSEDPDKAKEYVSAGVTHFDIEQTDVSNFATLAALARIVMNSPDAYSKR
jgi:Protein of unknown function (DUF1553)